MSRANPFELEPIEKASTDELRTLQLKRLKSSLQHSYRNVSNFKSKCDAIGVHPDNLSSLEGLSKFPFMDKQDFRGNYPFNLFAVPMDKIARIHASSGTTGQPAVVGYTQNDMDTWASLVARSLRAGGARYGDRVHNAFNYGLFSGGMGSHDGAQWMGLTVIPASGGQTERQVRLLRDFGSTIIMVTPSYLLTIADEADRQGINPKTDLRLRLAFVGAEPWSEAMRQEINERLNLQAVNYYGISEIIGPGVASECIETLDGLTLWEDHFYPEIIDPQTGKVLPDGSFGELVLTSLTKEALPVIRYRTRDLTRLLPGTARSMRRVDRFAGRSDDMLIIRGVNLFPSQVEEQILATPGLSAQYQLKVSRNGNLDELEIQVERRVETQEGESEALANQLRHLVKSMIGVNATVQVCNPETLPKSQGKAVRIIDTRNL